MKWLDLSFTGHRDGRNWTAAESMLQAISTSLHSGSYKSPVPEGKLTACLQPSALCLEQSYVWAIGRSDFCRAPADRECPWRTPSKVSALTPSKQKYCDKGKAPAAVQTSTSGDIKRWIETQLADIHASHPSEDVATAAAVQLGVDEPLTMIQLLDLANEMLRRLDEQQPYRKGVDIGHSNVIVKG